MLIAKYIGDDVSYEHHIGRNKPLTATNRKS